MADGGGNGGGRLQPFRLFQREVAGGIRLFRLALLVDGIDLHPDPGDDLGAGGDGRDLEAVGCLAGGAAIMDILGDHRAIHHQFDARDSQMMFAAGLAEGQTPGTGLVDRPGKIEFLGLGLGAGVPGPFADRLQPGTDMKRTGLTGQPGAGAELAGIGFQRFAIPADHGFGIKRIGTIDRITDLGAGIRRQDVDQPLAGHGIRRRHPERHPGSLQTQQIRAETFGKIVIAAQSLRGPTDFSQSKQPGKRLVVGMFTRGF